jgi:hypothetical protein
VLEVRPMKGSTDPNKIMNHGPRRFIEIYSCIKKLGPQT